MQIGKLKKIELREIWSREDTDFTNWLNDNLDILGEAIGLDLEESETECSWDNSNFRVDISATTKEGEKIIIENQLEQTNHKHLGQIMTYMINMETRVAVWIAKTVREEHMNVINWLNEFTDKDFYLIQLESYQIDESKPAPFLKVVCRPSIEMKAVGKQKKELSEAGKLKKDFWKKLLDRSSEKTDLFSKSFPSSWTIISHRVNKDVALAYRINKYRYSIAVLFEKSLKENFLGFKKELKNKLGFDFQFKNVGNAGTPSERYQIIKWFEKGGYRSSEHEWNEIQEEMIDNMIQLEKFLKPFLNTINISRKAS
ncbi:MAG: DUF4268 domain-containing protein [Bdellovibrionales bacterium]|nr:DUF4268 domain-containing protein [Bdellovibrionales bacterium]